MKSLESLMKSSKIKVKRQFNLIQSTQIDSASLMDNIRHSLAEKYTVTPLDTYELSVKIDRKKNGKDIESDVRSRLKSQIHKDLCINYLFDVFNTGSEVIVRIKRHNG